MVNWIIFRSLLTLPGNWKKAALTTIENGVMPKELALITSLKDVTIVNTQDFIGAIRKQLEAIL